MEIRNLIRRKVVLTNRERDTNILELEPYNSTNGGTHSYKHTQKEIPLPDINGIAASEYEVGIEGIPDPEDGVIYITWGNLSINAFTADRYDIYGINPYKIDEDGVVYADHIFKPKVK